MYQQITLIGNLGGDPEMRYTQDGVPVANFSLATNRRWTNQDGSQGEETAWFRVTAWRRLGEVCNEYLEKGRQVMVIGRIKPDPETGGPRVFTRRDGTPGSSFEVIAQTVKFLGGRGDGQGQMSRQSGTKAGPKPVPQQARAPVEEEEIPF